jgi:hypothetical protein
MAHERPVVLPEAGSRGGAPQSRDVRHDRWAVPSFDLARDAILVVDGAGRVVARAELYRNAADVRCRTLERFTT